MSKAYCVQSVGHTSHPVSNLEGRKEGPTGSLAHTGLNTARGIVWAVTTHLPHTLNLSVLKRGFIPIQTKQHTATGAQLSLSHLSCPESETLCFLKPGPQTFPGSSCNWSLYQWIQNFCIVKTSKWGNGKSIRKSQPHRHGARDADLDIHLLRNSLNSLKPQVKQFG